MIRYAMCVFAASFVIALSGTAMNNDNGYEPQLEPPPNHKRHTHYGTVPLSEPSAAQRFRAYFNNMGFKIAVPMAFTTMIATTLAYFLTREESNKEDTGLRKVALWISIPSGIGFIVGLGTQCHLYNQCKRTLPFMAKIFCTNTLCTCGLMGMILSGTLIAASFIRTKPQERTQAMTKQHDSR